MPLEGGNTPMLSRVDEILLGAGSLRRERGDDFLEPRGEQPLRATANIIPWA
jgi:hypothetical protein